MVYINSFIVLLLPNSKWYLVAIMPYGILNDRISELSDIRQYTILEACGVILIAILVIFILYFRMSQQQLKELNEAKRSSGSKQSKK